MNKWIVWSLTLLWILLRLREGGEEEEKGAGEATVGPEYTDGKERSTRREVAYTALVDGHYIPLKRGKGAKACTTTLRHGQEWFAERYMYEYCAYRLPGR
ncbi:MAG: hypothetical protein ACLU4J_16615 [Butyricimonas paravirosa]